MTKHEIITVKSVMYNKTNKK